jgi:hypothetical protein
VVCFEKYTEKSTNIKPADFQNLHLLFEKGKWGEHPMARSFSDRLLRCLSEQEWTTRGTGFVTLSSTVVACTDDPHLVTRSVLEYPLPLVFLKI